MDTVASKKLTREGEGAMKVLGAAVDRSDALDCHVSIAVVDDAGGWLIAGSDQHNLSTSRQKTA